jgi:hypothetical protein
MSYHIIKLVCPECYTEMKINAKFVVGNTDCEGCGVIFPRIKDCIGCEHNLNLTRIFYKCSKCTLIQELIIKGEFENDNHC